MPRQLRSSRTDNFAAERAAAKTLLKQAQEDFDLLYKLFHAIGPMLDTGEPNKAALKKLWPQLKLLEYRDRPTQGDTTGRKKGPITVRMVKDQFTGEVHHVRSNSWKEHTTGVCPVPADQRVIVRTYEQNAAGAVPKDQVDIAGELDWSQTDEPTDIAVYHVVKTVDREAERLRRLGLSPKGTDQ